MKPSPWTWNTAPPVERGWWVRENCRYAGGDLARLCDLFNLTEDGAKRILNGDIWRPEYERPAENRL